MVHTYETMRTAVDLYLKLDPWHQKDNIVPFLPPAWITEQLFAVGCHLLSGSTLNLAEEPETLMRDAREIEPTIAFFGARMWESQAAMVQSSMRDVNGLKKLSFHLFMPLGRRMADMRFRKKGSGIFLKAAHSLANIILFKPIRERLGLARARICYSTGAVISPDACSFYQSLGIPVRNVYITTEGGVLTCPRADDVDPETIGRPIDGIEVKATDRGEIVFRRQDALAAHGRQEIANASEEKGGWFSTGDAGFIRDDGHVVFLDRLSSVVELASGEKLLPQFVESRLRSSPYVKDAWVFGGPAGAYVSAVVVINYDTVSRWATQEKLRFNTFAELSQLAEVYGLLKKEIARVNGRLPAGTLVHKYVQLNKEFDPDAGEVTRARSLRRSVLEEHYRGLIEAVYADKGEIAVEVPTRLSDGTIGMKNIILRIERVEGASS